MATLFDPVPTVAPQVNPSPGQTIDVPEGAFGAATARAVTGFGGAVTKAAETGMDAITARQHLNNEVHASEVSTWLADQITDKYGQFTKLEGKTALDALPQFKQDIGDLHEQAVQQSGSLQERAMLSKSGAALTTRYYSYGERHASTQWRGWADKTAVDQAQAFGNVAGIAAANGDNDGMAQALHASDDAVAKLFEQRGWDQRAISTEVAKNRGRNLKQIIETQAAEDPLGAVNRFKEVSKEMDPASRLATQNHLRPIVTKLHGREIADEELGRAPNEEQRNQPAVGNVPSSFISAIKNFEGYAPKAKWDYKQFSSGYGTKAQFEGEEIDKPEAERRFGKAIDEAAKFVDSVNPDLDPGTRAALASLTYNAGTKWAESGLGDAIRKGDLGAAKESFLQYNKAGGETNAGLVARRAKEASWFGQGEAPFGGLPDKSVAFERIVDRTRNNPSLQDAALAHANKIYTVYNSERTQANAAFKGRVQDTTTEAMRTGTVQQPLTGQDFIENWGPEQGLKQYESYRQTLQLGADVASVADMSPTDRVAILKKYDPQPGEGFAEQTKRQDVLRTAINHAQTESQKDAGAFALDRLPAVKDAYGKFVEAQGGEDRAAATAASRNFVNVTLAEQERVGIPPDKRNVLPTAVANSILTGITKKTANAVGREGQSSFDLAANIQAQAELWGENWPLVYKQIEKEGGPLLRVIGSGVLPQAAAKLSELNGVTTQQILKNEDTDKPAEVKKQVIDAFKPFAATLVGAQDRLSLLDSFRGQGEKLAADYVVSSMGASDAAAKAFNDLLGHKYNFVSQADMSMRDPAGNTYSVPSSYRIPKDVPFPLSDIKYGAGALKQMIKPEDLANPRDTIGGLSPEYLAGVKPKTFARDAIWVTAPGDTGLMLVYNDEAVRTKAGTPYIKTWKEVAAAGKAAVEGWTNNAAPTEGAPGWVR